MWFTQRLLPALLLLAGLGLDTAHAHPASDMVSTRELGLRAYDPWTDLPKTGKPSKKQMDAVAKACELNGMCLFYRGAGPKERGLGLCEKQCKKEPNAGKKAKDRQSAIERTFISRQNGEKPNQKDQIDSLGGVTCYGAVEPNKKAVYKLDENGDQWIPGVCKCDVPEIAKVLVVFIANGLEELKKAIEEGLKFLCAASFGLLKDIVDWGISFIPGAGVAVRTGKITAKLVKAAKSAYEHGATGTDFFGDFVTDVCGQKPPFSFGPDALFDALVELPLSSLGDEKEMACKLAKGKKCKKVNSKPEPKKKTQLYKGKKGEEGPLAAVELCALGRGGVVATRYTICGMGFMQ
ncbi:uncharacterized protein PG998_005272 [Apiospora kogelbergensis]|uniref:uncharacterized protein n=1 Tax=Apiospora kogelbergensis TaxID=1337665 RepID=UPI00312E8F7D